MPDHSTNGCSDFSSIRPAIGSGVVLALVASALILISGCSENGPGPHDDPPQIISVNVSSTAVFTDGSYTLEVEAKDDTATELSCSWEASAGSFPNGDSGREVIWKAPSFAGMCTTRVFVSDEIQTVSDTLLIKVLVRTLAVDPDSLDFGTDLSNRSFQITNTGPDTLHWDTVGDKHWITVSPVSGTTATETDTVIVTVDRWGLAPGHYVGTAHIASDGGDDSVVVSMDVSHLINPVLSVDPDFLDFGEALTALSFDITNVGIGTLTWSLGNDEDWITLEPTSGSTTTEADQVTVTVSRAGLDPGSYTGTITVTSNGGSAAVPVSMEVAGEPVLSVHPTSLDFGLWEDVASVYISNTGTNTLTWTADDDQTWINTAPTSGSTTTETDGITVTVSRAGLAAGSYTGTVGIASNGGNAAVAVSMQVAQLWTWYFMWGSQGLRTFTYIGDGQRTSGHVTSGIFTLTFYGSADLPWAIVVVEDASQIAQGVTLEPTIVEVYYGGTDMGWAPFLEGSLVLYRASLTITSYDMQGPIGSVSGYLSGQLGTVVQPTIDPGTWYNEPIDILSATFSDIPVYGL